MAHRDKPKRKKQYRPQLRTQYGGLHVLASRIVNAEPLPNDQQVEVKADYYAAISAMIEGRGTGGHFDTLVYACNIARILANNGIGKEYRHLIYPALCAMARCKVRWQRTGKFGLDGEGLQALRDMGPLHEAQIEVTTASELGAALKEMHRRLAAGCELKDLEAA